MQELKSSMSFNENFTGDVTTDSIGSHGVYQKEIISLQKDILDMKQVILIFGYPGIL